MSLPFSMHFVGVFLPDPHDFPGLFPMRCVFPSPYSINEYLFLDIRIFMMNATSLNERSFAFFPAFYQKNGKKVYNSRNFAPPSPEIVPGSFPAPRFFGQIGPFAH